MDIPKDLRSFPHSFLSSIPSKDGSITGGIGSELYNYDKKSIVSLVKKLRMLNIGKIK